MDPEVCPACGDGGSIVLTPAKDVGRRHEYLICDTCGWGRITPFPDSSRAESYDRDYFVDGGGRAGYVDYEAEAVQHRRTARLRLRRIDNALHRRDSGLTAAAPLLVDVGTAVGFLPDEARRVGYDVAGVEVSEWAAERARHRGIRVVPDLGLLGDLRGRVDCVSFFQVLEHMPDPEVALRKSFDLMRPGGILICETWDVQSRTARFAGTRWQQLSPPSVLWLFSHPGMRRMLERNGFEPISWRVSPKAVSLSTVLGQAVDRVPVSVSRATLPVSSRIPVPYVFDDLVTFVARRV